MLKVGVLGATGFTGEKLVEILINHPQIKVTYLGARIKEPIDYSAIFPKFYKKTNINCEPFDLKKALKSADLVFLSLPHTVSMHYAGKIIAAGKKAIDLSADYRLDAKLYRKFYKATHVDKLNLKKAVYGLPELFASQIKKACLVANPGCYPTSAILALYPLVLRNLIETKIVVDSKSAITGAGRKASIDFHYSNVESNFWAYKPFSHQHQPEISRFLKKKTGKTVKVCFLPQVAAFGSGIYSTIYVWFKSKLKENEVKKIYQQTYKGLPFIRVCNGFPKLKDVVGTNFCDLGIAVDKEGKQAVIVSSIDNLIKGAAGQAIQNMNLMCGFEETAGLL